MAKAWTMIIGWVLIILGVAGFFSNSLAGMNGFFHADAMHNLIDIILGAILLWSAYSAPAKARTVAKWEGVIYLILAILGWLIIGTGTGSLLGIMEVNGADNWLHLVLGLVLLTLGIRTRSRLVAEGR